MKSLLRFRPTIKLPGQKNYQIVDLPVLDLPGYLFVCYLQSQKVKQIITFTIVEVILN